MKKAYTTGYFCMTLAISAMYFPYTVFSKLASLLASIVCPPIEFVVDIGSNIKQGAADCLHAAKEELPSLKFMVTLWNTEDGPPLILFAAGCILIPMLIILYWILK